VLSRWAIFILLAGLATFQPPELLAQENPRDRLDRLRVELDSLSQVLSGFSASEKDLGGKINALDQQIVTRKRLIRELERQRQRENSALQTFDKRINSGGQQLAVVQDRLRSTSGEVAALEDEIARRTIFIYKRGSRESLRFLLAAETPGEFVRRRLYVERITDRDRKNLSALRNVRERHAKNQQELEAVLADLRSARESKAQAVRRIENLVAEGRAERTKLEKDRGRLDGLLVDLRRDKEAVLGLIEDRKSALRQVEEWIASLERERSRGGVQEIKVSRRPGEIVIRPVEQFDHFSRSRGKLPWPVYGPVVNRFGLERNKITGTLTENPGIDIRTREGEEVLSVQAGICTRITYLRGFGTTVLVEHGDGYYTVYAHLGDVWISEGERVEAGRVIGTVGGGVAGDPSLHFQVWHKRQKEDPMQWLKS